MKKNIFLLVLAVGLALVLAACGGSDNNDDGNANGASNDNGENNEANDDNDGDSDMKAALVTDVGGVDDKSFNQSAWEGLQEWGDEHGLEEEEDYDYAQSESDSDYTPNLQNLVREDFDLVYGIGFKLEKAMEDIAENYPDKKFGIVDSVIEDQDNIVSITFADNESAFLTGVAAANKTESDKVGFIGGEESDIIEAFEVGFRAGVKSVDEDIDVEIQYSGNFDSGDDGKLIASSMFDDDRDVVMHAAGDTGNGLFAEAIDRKKNDPDQNIWAIGVDRDQYDEGEVDDDNITLTSAVKRVDNAVQDVNNMAMEGDFPGGELMEFDLDDEGVGYTETNEEGMTDEIVDEVDDWKELIIDGDVDVPHDKDELEEYFDNL